MKIYNDMKKENVFSKNNFFNVLIFYKKPDFLKEVQEVIYKISYVP